MTIGFLRSVGVFFFSMLLLASDTCFGQEAQTTPNIVLILIDDAALQDLGAYGGEADTPNIDALANRGTLFTQYRASLMCAPSRAMLLTGYDSHLTGVPNLSLIHI